jgi:hypothetical protein
MRDEQFEQRLAQGRSHEPELVLILRRRSFFVTPTGDIANGGAPRLLGPNGTAIVLPDVEAYRDAKCFPFELKTKSSFTWTCLTQRYESGFSLRLYEHYLKYEKVTGHRLIIVMRDLHTGEFLARKLDHLTPRFYRGPKMGPSGMVFFHRDDFFCFHQGTACDLPLFKDLPVPPTRPFRDVEEM